MVMTQMESRFKIVEHQCQLDGMQPLVDKAIG